MHGNSWHDEFQNLPLHAHVQDLVRTFQQMSREKVNALLARTARAAIRGEFEPFKTSSLFDSTAQNPARLGDEPQRLQELVKETTPRTESDEAVQEAA